MNLLSALPEWFTSWGWIVIVAAAAVIAVCVIVLIIRAKMKGGEEVSEQEPGVEASSEEPVAEETAWENAAAEEREDEPAVEEPVTEEPAVEEPVEEAPAEETEDGAESAEAPAEEVKEKAKPVNKTYHVSKRNKTDGRWQVRIGGGSKAIKTFATQLEAIEFAKKLAENQEAKIVIHKEDGSFRRLTYHKKNK